MREPFSTIGFDNPIVLSLDTDGFHPDSPSSYNMRFKVKWYEIPYKSIEKATGWPKTNYR